MSGSTALVRVLRFRAHVALRVSPLVPAPSWLVRRASRLGPGAASVRKGSRIPKAISTGVSGRVFSALPPHAGHRELLVQPRRAHSQAGERAVVVGRSGGQRFVDADHHPGERPDLS